MTVSIANPADTALALRSATDLTQRLRRRELSSRELLDLYLRRIATHNQAVNAVVTIDEERARRSCAAADEATAHGDVRGALHGLPITVKDCIETAGIRTTAGSPTLIDHVPERDATAVARLRAAGAIVFGKTNLPEWAGDAQSYNDVFGTTNNPWDLTRTPGGSSGGAAAAIASGMTALETGSDLAGSLRIPAHFCGVFTLKPTFGIVTTRGHVPPLPGALADMDVCALGPLARSADDLDLWLSAVAGPDEARAAAWRLQLPPSRASHSRRLRIAACLDDAHCEVDAEIVAVLELCLERLRESGDVVDITQLPVPLAEAHELSQRIIQPVLSHAMPAADFDALLRTAVQPGDGSGEWRWARNVTQRVRQLNIALEQRAQHAVRWAAFFRTYDALLTPTMPMTAFRHDHEEPRTPLLINGSLRSHDDLFAWPQAVGVMHLPAAVAPTGLTESGLPTGVQIVGPLFGDRTVVDVARRIERVSGWFQVPPLDGVAAIG